ncbi:MAG: OmpA family protein [Deltaproteobacteria bacterium]|nr:OmpA family protein [Deltaproteobacteria bacterium]
MSSLFPRLSGGALLLLVLLLSACGVRKDLYQSALDTIAESQDKLTGAAGELEACNAGIRELTDSLSTCKDEIEGLAAARDEVLADNAALRAQLRAAGQDVDALLEEKSSMSGMLDEANRALAAARERQKQAEARDAIYTRLRERLQSMIDAGKLNVRIVRGRMVIDLKQDILFPSGSSTLSDIGMETLAEVADALSEFDDRSFQVEGHTDNVPIKNDRFPSNWELSTARAVSVVKLFASKGMTPENLSAAGYGEFQPRADNASAEGRTLNRRIEVVMLPDLQALPDLVQGL